MNASNTWARGSSLERQYWGHPSRSRGGFSGRGRGGFTGRHGRPTTHARGSWRNNFDRWGSDSHSRGGYQRYDDQQQFNWDQKRAPKRPIKRLSEKDIGITEYVSEHSGFSGIIKSRFSDFQVSEIDLQGQIAKLTDMSVPEAPKKEEVVEDEDLFLSKYNLEILPMETWDKIHSISISAVETSEKVEIDVTGMSKEQRTKIHEAVKQAFGASIVGSTVAENDKKFCRFEKFRKGVRVDTRVKWAYPGDYVHFIVHKINCDTMEAAAKLADRIPSMNPSLVGYAGTKDKRAKTSQWFSVRRAEPRLIAKACEAYREIAVGNFTFSNTHIQLGMLKGNRFRIALRNVKQDEKLIDEKMNDLKEKGYLNYYGLQRFGSRIETPTYMIGIKLLQEKWKEAIDCILDEHEGPLYMALKRYHQGDIHGALQQIPRTKSRTPEAKIIKALAKNPKAYAGALDQLARNARMLYLHSYQSLVWNKCASERVRRFGLNPVAGDLVLEQATDLNAVLAEECDSGSDTDEEDDSVERSVDPPPASSDSQSGEPKPECDKTETENKKKEIFRIPVKVLSESDVESGKYTIFDVILPLPGFAVQYSPNMVEYYEQLMASDGVDLNTLKKNRKYCVAGAYRPLIGRPSDVEWHVVRYSDPKEDLILSDIDELQGVELTPKPDGEYKALIVQFSLLSCSYATMALRELLRTCTSSESQAKQDDYHKESGDANGDNAEATEDNAEATEDNAEATEDNAEATEDNAEATEDNAEATEDNADSVQPDETEGSDGTNAEPASMITVHVDEEESANGEPEAKKVRIE